MEEMPNSYDSDSDQSGGSNIILSKRPRMSCQAALREGDELTSHPMKHSITAMAVDSRQYLMLAS